MSMGVQDAIRRLKGHLCACEKGLIFREDAGDEHVLDGADLPTKFNEMLAAVKDARARLDAAHELLRTDLHNDGDGDDELSSRSRQLHIFDRADVGEVARVAPSHEVGGAHLMARAGAAQ
jgi:hypothetical protein